MKNSLNNDNKDSKINIDTILKFCKSHAKYISAGILTLILVVVLAVSAVVNAGKDDSKKEAQETEQQEKDGTEQYEINKNEDLKKLVENYYKYYSAGDVKKLAKVAKPVSDMEKSYIKMMSGFVESYEDVACYTKSGLKDGSYMVSVTYEMKFQDVKGTLPGMEFFYVNTNKDGKLYIDNLYSSFNGQMKEQETDAEIIALIDGFKENSDVKELQADFQKKYTEAVSSNKKLQKMVNKVTAGIEGWAESYVAKEKKKEQKKADEQKAQDEQKKAEEAQKKTEEEQKKAEDEQKKAEEDQKKADEQKKAEEDQKKTENEQKAQDEQQEETDNDSGVNYVPEGKVLTTNDAYNLRATMSETGELMGTVPIGDSIKVVLSYAEGWTKVEWNGKIGYIKTELLLNN